MATTEEELADARELETTDESVFVHDEIVDICGYCGRQDYSCIDIFDKRRVILTGQSKPPKW